MIAWFKDYSGKYRIVSLAVNEETKKDLINEAVDFICVENSSVKLYPEDLILSVDSNIIGKLNCYHNYDVFELEENGKLLECYDDTSNDNYFFVTGKCNSNCIMCPSPDVMRQQPNGRSIDNLIEIARHIPEDISHLTITGGEPFMVGSDIFRFFQFLKDKFENTEFLLLTNGRIFAVNSYVSNFISTKPNNCIVAIPIHGSTKQIHDKITQTVNSFEQTVEGIRNLLRNKVRVELRIVVSKLNIDDIDNIALLIVKEFPSIEYVSIMAMEMTGSARVNKDAVWIPYVEAAKSVKKAVYTLANNGIDVKLYNFPLCSVSKELWPLCKKSISPNKVRYSEECFKCKMLSSCGGVFAGTISMEKGELRAFI